jgi:hypothetical protein
MAGSKEDTETVRAFFQDMRGRGLGDPLLVVSDGGPGIIRAIEECFPRSARQRCLAHRMRNLAVKVLTDLWPELQGACERLLPSPLAGHPRELAKGMRADYGTVLPRPSPASRTTSRPASGDALDRQVLERSRPARQVLSDA